MKPLSHLDRLEAESLHIFREVASEFSNPVLLYSIGKDSTVMLHLALKAFWPSLPPFPLLHVDSLWEFAAMGAFRDTLNDLRGDGDRAAAGLQPSAGKIAAPSF